MTDSLSQAPQVIQVPQPQQPTHPMPQQLVHPDLAKHTLSSNEFKSYIYGFVAGWQEVDVEIEYKTALGRTQTKVIQRVIKNLDARLGNDSAADYIWKVMAPLVAASTGASKYDPSDTYNMFRGKVRNELTSTLTKKILFEGNPFEMKLSSVPEIISTLSEMYLPAKKGEKGWWWERTAASPTASPDVSISTDHHGGIEATMKQRQGWFSGLWNRGR